MDRAFPRSMGSLQMKNLALCSLQCSQIPTQYLVLIPFTCSTSLIVPLKIEFEVQNYVRFRIYDPEMKSISSCSSPKVVQEIENLFTIAAA